MNVYIVRANMDNDNLLNQYKELCQSQHDELDLARRKLTDVYQELHCLRAEKNDLTETISQRDEQIKELVEWTSTLQSQKDMFVEKISDLEAQLSDKENLINELILQDQNVSADKTSDLKNYLADIDKLNSEVASLKASLTEKDKQLIELTEWTSILQADIDKKNAWKKKLGPLYPVAKKIKHIIKK